MKFPRLVFRCPGKEACQGGTYDHALVSNLDEYGDRLADGWHGTLPEALAPAPVIITAKPADSVIVPPEPPADTVAPTSEEIRRKASELGLKVHHKASDATVLAMVTAELAKG